MNNYTIVPGIQVVDRTAEALRTSTNIEVEVVPTAAEALDVLIGRIPEGSEIFPGTSVTLEQIGFVDYLEQNPDRYRNWRKISAGESDTTKRAELRRRTPMVDYFIGSVQAVAETGELVIASRTGSQLAGYVYSARNVIWVIGAQKITANLESAIRRVREHTLPLESSRIRQTGSTEDSRIGKLLIFENERQLGRVIAIIVNEPLGF